MTPSLYPGRSIASTQTACWLLSSSAAAAACRPMAALAAARALHWAVDWVLRFSERKQARNQGSCGTHMEPAMHCLQNSIRAGHTATKLLWLDACGLMLPWLRCTFSFADSQPVTCSACLHVTRSAFARCWPCQPHCCVVQIAAPTPPGHTVLAGYTGLCRVGVELEGACWGPQQTPPSTTPAPRSLVLLASQPAMLARTLNV